MMSILFKRCFEVNVFPHMCFFFFKAVFKVVPFFIYHVRCGVFLHFLHVWPFYFHGWPLSSGWLILHAVFNWPCPLLVSLFLSQSWLVVTFTWCRPWSVVYPQVPPSTTILEEVRMLCLCSEDVLFQVISCESCWFIFFAFFPLSFLNIT